MKNLLFIFLLLSLFFEGFAQKSCPVPDPCTHTDVDNHVFGNGDVLCLLTGTFNLGTINGSLNGNNLGTLYVAPGVVVNADGLSLTLNGSSEFQVINEGVWNQEGMQIKSDLTFNNCESGVLEMGTATLQILGGGVLNNFGTINADKLINNSSGEIYNSGQINIDGNFTNNGFICGPTTGCGSVTVGGVSRNGGGGNFSADASGDPCGNIDICDSGAGGFDTQNGIVGTSGTICQYDAVAGNCGAVIMPVEFVKFTSKPIEDAILINWKTTSETDNDYFWVEKSSNGVIFETIGKVEGNGTSSTIQQYEFIDKEAKEGTNYYRLNQIDYDGASNLSKIIVSYFTTELDLKLTVFPNPSNGEGFSLRVRNLRETVLKAKMVIYSSQGQILVSNDLLLDGSDIEIQNKLAQGSYFIELVGREFNLKKRLVIN